MSQQIASAWRNRALSPTARGHLFDQMLDVYRFSYLGEDHHERFVRSCLVEETAFSKVQQSMSLVATQLDANGVSHRPTDTALLDSMVYRYPVYYGGPVTTGDTREVLGYDSDPSAMPQVEGGVRYAYGGFARVDKEGWGKEDGIVVVHVWGVNLESRGTHDFKTYVDQKTNKLKTDTYKIAVKKTLHIAFLAAVQSATRLGNTGGEVCVRLPLIGLGAFLSALPERMDAALAHAAFFESITELLAGDGVSSELARVRVVVCIFDQSVHHMLSYQQWMADTRTRTLMGEKRVVEERDLFGVQSPPADPTQRTICLVNAWDSRSFVGNGGASDPTIDGFMVAARGPGRTLPNSSWLHNPFFATALLDSERWTFV